MVDKEQVMSALKKCYDPEISLNVVDLGMIYGINISNETVKIKMTLTSPGCPMQSFIIEDIKNKILKIDGVKKVEVELVFDPPWSPERMSAAAKKRLGMN
jgi:metal-sulfur cluster biosynthetic enzyme